MREKIIIILMERDDLSRTDAISILDEVQELVNAAVARGSYFEVEDILANELGLEMDYVWAFI